MKNLIVILFLCLTTPIQTMAQTENITDKEIKNMVTLELRLQPDVPAQLIEIKVEDGIVTLSGYTNNLLAIDRAVKTAKAVRGVRGVINQLSITTTAKSDNQIEKNIEEAFIRNAATDLFEINVDVNEGEATLGGSVDSWQEKQLAEFVAKGVKGVVSIDNRITVDYNVNRSDYDIKKDIEGLLANDVRIQSENINVEVNKGNVMLTGKVSSAAKKGHAEILSWVAGVKNVNTQHLNVDVWADNNNKKDITDYNRSDKEVEAAIKDVFYNDPRLNAFNINVNANNGRVTLSGTVDNLQAKYAAEKDASNVVGVYDVKSFISVEPRDIPKNEILEERINNAFFEDPYLEQFEINVSAKEGKVYLGGLVDNYFEKYHAEDLASSLNGVVMVDNNISVQDEIATEDAEYYYDPDWNTSYPLPYTQLPDLTEERSDWEIKQQIENQMWWSPDIEESQVNVQVDNGIATLTGTVDTWEEKQNATKNAVQGGAEEVKNELKVESQPELEQE